MHRVLLRATALFLLCVLTIAGCDPRKDAVLAAYEQGEVAIESYDPIALEQLLTPATREELTNVIAMARSAPREQVEALQPSLKQLVLALRNRTERARLATMDLHDHLLWQIEEEFLIIDAEWGIKPSRVTITDQSAIISFRGENGMQAVGTANYQLVDGEWRWNYSADNRTTDAQLQDDAQAESVSLNQHLLNLEESAFGSVKPSLWDPPFPTTPGG